MSGKVFNERFVNSSLANSPSVCTCINVVVQFCPWFKFYFLLFWGMVIYDNEFETKKNKI